MSGFFGADVEQLRQLGRDLTAQAEQLDATVARLNSKVLSVPWHGPDAAQFRSDWSQRLSVSVKSAAEVLRVASTKALANAVQQEQASSALGTTQGADNGSSLPLTHGGGGLSGFTPDRMTPGDILEWTRQFPDLRVGQWTVGDYGQLLPGVGEVLDVRDYADKISHGQIPIHEMVSTAAGELRSGAYGPEGYLVGAGAAVWNSAWKAAEHADFSHEQIATNSSYLQSNPGDALAAAGDAVVKFVPELIGDLKWW